MVQIIKKEPHPTVVKEVICRKCGVTLSYVPLDVKEDYSTDYTGGKDYFNYVECANCNKKVRVRL